PPCQQGTRDARRLPAVPAGAGECAGGMTTPLPVEQLRKKHPRFIYHSFAVKRCGEALRLRYRFTLEPDIQFTPETIIAAVDWDRIATLSPGTLERLAFHLGLIETLSYWKAACSPEL